MATKPAKEETVQISAPNIKTLAVRLIGTAPYVQLRFSQKAMNLMMDGMRAGPQAKTKKKREPRDFEDDFKQAMHISEEGWNGIPASSFRNAMISACRLVGFKMTLAKLSVFIEADGLDVVDSVPLIKIIGDPEPLTMPVRNATGVADIRVRAKFDPWSAVLNIKYDNDQFSETDIINLIHRVGCQVGIGEGRPDSKASAGMGWGTFELGEVAEIVAA